MDGTDHIVPSKSLFNYYLIHFGNSIREIFLFLDTGFLTMQAFLHLFNSEKALDLQTTSFHRSYY